MNMDDWLLVTNEPVEFDEKPVEVLDFMKVTDQFRGIYGIYLESLKENQKINM